MDPQKPALNLKLSRAENAVLLPDHGIADSVGSSGSSLENGYRTSEQAELPAPDALHTAESSGLPPHRRRRRVLWGLGIVLVFLLLAMAPPLLNVSRMRRRIAASISATLGRPVRLDQVQLHLLPMPGFTLTNLVISEDPRFGYEPIIRAETVEATLRPSSLWRRQVEFSTIRFVEPSLNLVRSKEGRWNLQALLMHAAAAGTAPTAQSKPGPEPRFPYIEATGARVNLKLDEEKQPFSLLDADFALWLPTPQQWRIRLKARPARTDSNIGDPGTMRLEGSLQRAADMSAVPVDLVASWRDAPLGEASRLLTGEDAGWRGTLDLDATLSGHLGEAHLTTEIHLNDLRRADFVPAASLNLNIDCNAILETPAALIHDPDCLLRSPRINAVADGIDLTSHTVTGLRIGSPGVPEAWALQWTRLFSQRVPGNLLAHGMITGSITAATLGQGPADWQGQVRGNAAALVHPPGSAVEAAASPASPGASTTPQPQFTLLLNGGGATLAPVNLAGTGSATPLWLSGIVGHQGYTLHLQGSATLGEIRGLQTLFPPLTDGLETATLPEPATATNPDSEALLPIDVDCTRAWGSEQACAAASAAPAKVSHPRHTRRHSGRG